MRLWMCLVLIPAMLLNRGIETSAADENIFVRILFTNNSNGKLVDCNCRDDPYGGLAERIGLVRSYREKYPDVLLLDSGGYFGLSGIEQKGPVVLKLMEIMEYEACGIGDQEIYHGLDRFLELFGWYNDRIINASLYTVEGLPVFTTYRIINVNGMRIGITGLVSDETFKYFHNEIRDFTVAEPDSVINRVIPILRGSSDYIIVLSQMGVEMDRKVAEKWPDIDLIIGGHSQTLLKKAITISNSHIVQAGKNGGMVGEVFLTFDKSKKIRKFSYNLLEVSKKYKIPQDIMILPDIQLFLGNSSQTTDD